MVEFKTCTKCGKSYPATTEFFYTRSRSRDGLQSWCKACVASYRAIHKEERRAYNQGYRLTRKEQAAVVRRAYCQAHKEEIAAAAHIYYAAHKEEKAAAAHAYYETHKEQVAAAKRVWHELNRERVAEHARNHYQTNPMLRVSNSIAKGMRDALHGKKAGRHWEELVGYTLADLRTHLEAHFLPGMTWENYGKWHIDHAKPQSAFVFTAPDEPSFKTCWALDNLQPLWAKDNMRKRTRESALLVTDQRLRRRQSK